MVQRTLAIIGLLVVLMGFQNCAETKFNSTDDAFAAKGSLVPLASDDSDMGSASGVLFQDDDSNSGDDSSSDDDLDLVACILDGPGKSIKLGLSDDVFGGVNSVAKSVCISEKACTEIVPKLFAVKGPEDRGYCDQNPNVIRLTDAEVQALVDAALKN